MAIWYRIIIKNYPKLNITLILNMKFKKYGNNDV